MCVLCCVRAWGAMNFSIGDLNRLHSLSFSQFDKINKASTNIELKEKHSYLKR